MTLKNRVIFLLFGLLLFTGCGGGPEPDPTPSPADSPTTSPDASPGGLPAEPEGEDLADGRHFGFIRNVDVQGSSISFDVAVFLTGDEAQQAAQERGEALGDDVFDYFIVNDDPATRTLQVAGDARIQILTGGGADLGSSTLQGLSDHLPRPENGFWIGIENGEIVEVEEQYVP